MSNEELIEVRIRTAQMASENHGRLGSIGNPVGPYAVAYCRTNRRTLFRPVVCHHLPTLLLLFSEYCQMPTDKLR